ncbi:hypothetical protein GOP47_0013694 [Adiantum capillus-veneris]|uniref:ZF-HD dimerization-type domain-containing protein n=1 Tax=Adiantum capillus-veneris TaxID=13818 RepID=A0A9D4UP06_ADICA|nr:hypothetical protein GOP47_0013694 [Adiantum capillus-veneris]
MDIRGQPHDMTSLPMHSHSSSSFKQQHVSSMQHVEGGGASVLPSVAKVKIITGGSTSHGGGAGLGLGSNGLASASTTSTSAGISYGNHGLAPSKIAIAGGAPAGSYGNNISPTSTSAGAGGSYGHNGLTLSSGSPSEPAGGVDPRANMDNNGKTTASNIHTSSALPKSPPAIHTDDLRLPSSLELKPSKKPVRYRECLKNHAANLGGHANDGCGEFMPSGEEGTIEALKCAACNCHRNFHRREVEGEGYGGNCECRYGIRDRKRMMEPLFPSPLPLPPPPGLRVNPRSALPSSQMIMAFNSHDSDEYEGGLMSPHSSLKKRFRTKFTAEQKEQMGIFAEKLGWRIQKHDETAVQQFCAEIGVKRHVLKVWMHNNKHALGKKLLTQGSIAMGFSASIIKSLMYELRLADERIKQGSSQAEYTAGHD